MFWRAKKTWLSWHRGLPNPPGKPDFSLALVRRAFKENNAVYWKGLKSFYFGLIPLSKEKKKSEVDIVERESTKAADELAAALNSSRAVGPAVFKKWMAERMALFSDVLIQFGTGFREGKNAPDNKIDWKDWMNKK